MILFLTFPREVSLFSLKGLVNTAGLPSTVRALALTFPLGPCPWGKMFFCVCRQARRRVLAFFSGLQCFPPFFSKQFLARNEKDMTCPLLCGIRSISYFVMRFRVLTATRLEFVGHTSSFFLGARATRSLLTLYPPFFFSPATPSFPHPSDSSPLFSASHHERTSPLGVFLSVDDVGPLAGPISLGTKRTTQGRPFVPVNLRNSPFEGAACPSPGLVPFRVPAREPPFDLAPKNPPSLLQAGGASWHASTVV